VSQRSIPTGKQFLLPMRTATTEGALLCMPTKNLARLLNLNVRRLPTAGETYTQGGLVDWAHRGFTRITVLTGIHLMPVMRIV
jgi:hypothetical protein